MRASGLRRRANPLPTFRRNQIIFAAVATDKIPLVARRTQDAAAPVRRLLQKWHGRRNSSRNGSVFPRLALTGAVRCKTLSRRFRRGAPDATRQKSLYLPEETFGCGADALSASRCWGWPRFNCSSSRPAPRIFLPSKPPQPRRRPSPGPACIWAPISATHGLHLRGSPPPPRIFTISPRSAGVRLRR